MVLLLHHIQREWGGVGDILTYLVVIMLRFSLTPDEQKTFWRNVQFTVDKDVVRTDRSHQFFRGENNPNVETMR